MIDVHVATMQPAWKVSSSPLASGGQKLHVGITKSTAQSSITHHTLSEVLEQDANGSS